MALPPPPRSTNRASGSLEAEPIRGEQRPAVEATAATLEAQREAEAKRVRGESAHQRTDISLQSLEGRIDVQEQRSIEQSAAATMLATLLTKDPAIERDLNLADTANLPRIAQRLATIGPRGVEGNLLRNALNNKDSEAGRRLRAEWPQIVAVARAQSRQMKALLAADFRKKYGEAGGGGALAESVTFVKKHPLVSLGIMLGGAAIVYSLYSKVRGMFGGGKKDEEEKKGGEGDKDATSGGEKKEGGGILKWLVGAGLAIAGLFGLGRLLGTEGVRNFFKEKLGWDIEASRIPKVLTHLAKREWSEAWEAAWEGSDTNKDFHIKMAELISKDGKKVEPHTLFELKDEKFSDFMSDLATYQDEASTTAGEYFGKWAKPFLDSKEQNQEQIAVRAFLRKHEAHIRKIMPIRDTTTIEEVLQRLHADLTGQEIIPGAVAVAAGGVAAAAAVPSSSPDTSPEAKERDQARAHLSPDKQPRAVANEQVLSQKISFHDIEQMRKDMDAHEAALRTLLSKPISPEDRQKVEAKLQQLAEQREAFERLSGEHDIAYLNYLEAMQSDAGEAVLIEKFAALIEAKEKMEELHAEVFEREGWTVLTALASTHALRFATSAYRRWLKAGNIANDHANYLFDKFKERLSPRRLKEAYRRLRTKPTPRTLTEIQTETDEILGDMQRSMDEWDAASPHRSLGGENLGRKHFAALDGYERRVAEQHRQLQGLWNEKQKALKQALKSGNKSVAEGLIEEITAIGKAKVRLEFGEMSHCGTWFERWQSAFKGDPHNPVYERGLNKLRMYFRKAMRSRVQVEEVTTGAMAKFSRVVMRRGRLVFLAGSVVLGGEALHDEKTGRGKAYAQAGLGAVPLVGTYLDFYSAIAGKEQITGRKLDASDRAIASVFGVVGLASDVLTVFGVGLIGKAAIVGVKAGRGMAAAARVSKVVREIEAARDVAQAGKVVRRFEQINKARKFAFRVGLGMALGQAASMVFTQEAELPVSEEFKRQIIGDSQRELSAVAADMGLPNPEAPTEGAGQAEAA